MGCFGARTVAAGGAFAATGAFEGSGLFGGRCHGDRCGSCLRRSLRLAFAAAFLDVFFAAFLTAFLATFFAADVLAPVLALAAFFAFLIPRLPVLAARDFAAAFLVARAGDAFFVFLAFLDDFFLAVATTESFADRNEIVGSLVRQMLLSDGCLFRSGVYRVASASIENTEKTSGLRSRL